MTALPIWFLDVDGVINALARPAPAGYQVTTARTMGRGWRIAFSRSVIGFVNRVNREGLVEVRWLTTWQQDAQRELAPAVGLDSFPSYGDRVELEVRNSWWKRTVVTDETTAHGRPFIWTDDDIDSDTIKHFHENHESNLLIAPDPETGLAACELTRIRSFLLDIRNRA